MSVIIGMYPPFPYRTDRDAWYTIIKQETPMASNKHGPERRGGNVNRRENPQPYGRYSECDRRERMTRRGIPVLQRDRRMGERRVDPLSLDAVALNFDEDDRRDPTPGRRIKMGSPNPMRRASYGRRYTDKVSKSPYCYSDYTA